VRVGLPSLRARGATRWGGRRSCGGLSRPQPRAAVALLAVVAVWSAFPEAPAVADVGALSQYVARLDRQVRAAATSAPISATAAPSARSSRS
jgi:hypothetical protein